MAASESEAQETLIGCKVLWKEELGHGAFGTVYRGKDPNGDDIAIKRMSAEHRFRRSARKEIDSYRELTSNHENIIRILGYFEQCQVLYILMEYCRLGDLSKYYMKYYDIVNSINAKVSLMVQISNGLAFLHRNAIAHRDIKARNILVSGDPDDPHPLRILIKICDFGEAKFLSDNTTMHSNVGTRAYKAPEFYVNNTSHETIKYHKNVDVFAEGLVFWLMIYARKGAPFEPILPMSERRGGSGGEIGHEIFLRKIQNIPPLNIAYGEPGDCPATSQVKSLIRDQLRLHGRPSAQDVSQRLRTIYGEVCFI